MVTEPGWRRFRPMSIALRTAAWYALSAFALIVVATGFLYWVLITNLAYEDNRTLADNLDSMRLLLHSSPGGALPLRPVSRSVGGQAHGSRRATLGSSMTVDGSSWKRRACRRSFRRLLQRN